ncbi:SPFH domain-containing protein [Teredinibacter waterburyi]|jgi:SPFH domain, Band 7 family protein|uniref:SPFH domain-containing protein n=1 Tax=Teredinibacter waterburyi TaxID=1500538 RepID=UPI00165F10D0|nr:slipin family protein [Teredinibacter waterburyi]
MDAQTLVGNIFSIQAFVLIFIIFLLTKLIRFVPQNSAYVIERFGKYNRTLDAGMNLVIPLFERVAHNRSLKEQAVDVPSQGAITRDNISLTVDGVLYFRVIDAYRASYGVEDYSFAVVQLAQTTMRSEIGKMELDKTFEERDVLNTNIVQAINEAAEPWGVVVLRYEIKDIIPPQSVMSAMESQMRAERERRAKILESEGDKQAVINRAEGDRQSQVLAAEGDKQQQILSAQGEAEAIMAVAQAQADALRVIGSVSSTVEGQSAVQLDLATKAIEARHAIAKESSVVLLPDQGTDPASVVAQAMAVLNATKAK